MAKAEKKSGSNNNAKSEYLNPKELKNLDPGMQDEQTYFTSQKVKTARSNSATMLKDRIVDKAKKSVPISSKVHPKQELLNLVGSPYAFHQRETSEQLLSEAAQKGHSKPAQEIEIEADILSNEFQLIDLSKRIETCLSSSKSTLSKTSKFLSLRNISLHEMWQYSVVRPSEILGREHDDDNDKIRPVNEFNRNNDSPFLKDDEEIVRLMNLSPERAEKNFSTQAAKISLQKTFQSNRESEQKAPNASSNLGRRTIVKSLKLPANGINDKNSSKITADKYHPTGYRTTASKQLPLSQNQLESPDEVKSKPKKFNNLKKDSEGQLEVNIERAELANTADYRNRQMLEKPHTAGKQKESDTEEKQQSNRYSPERHSNTLHPQTQSSELSSAIQENRNNAKALEKLQQTHQEIASKPFKKLASKSHSGDSQSPNSNLKKLQRTPEKSRASTNSGKKLTKINNFSSTQPSHKKPENTLKNSGTSDKATKNPNQKQKDFKSLLKNPRSSTSEMSRSASPRDISRTRSIEKIPLDRDLEDSFDKLHTAKKRLALNSSGNFDERMGKDIDFRHKKDQDLLAFLKQHQTKLSPQEIDELYARLIHDAKQREIQKRKLESEKEIAEMSQVAKSARDSRSSGTLFERLAKDTQRRSIEKLEKLKMKEQEEMRFKEEMAKKKLSKETSASLVIRMVEDAVRRKNSKEKILQAKLEQEIKGAKENATKTIRSSPTNSSSKIYSKTRSKPTEFEHKDLQEKTLPKSSSSRQINKIEKQDFALTHENLDAREHFYYQASISHRLLENRPVDPPVSLQGKNFERKRQPSFGSLGKKIVHHNDYGLPRVDDLSSIAMAINATDQLSAISMTLRLSGTSNNQLMSPQTHLAVSSNPTNPSLPEEIKTPHQNQRASGNKVPKIKLGRESKNDSKKPSSFRQHRAANHVSKGLTDLESRNNYMNHKEAVNYVNDLLKNFKIRGIERLGK